MRLLKNKIILLAISVLGIFGGLGLFIVVGNVYGYDEGMVGKVQSKTPWIEERKKRPRLHATLITLVTAWLSLEGILSEWEE